MDKEIYKKADSILGRMSLDQKIGQMTQTERMAISPEEVREFHIGSVLSGGGSTPGDNRVSDWVEMNQAYWQASVQQDEDHLGIPIIYGVDAIHGHNNARGATIFPHNIGLGAARDPELIERIAKVTAREILATGVEWTFAPTLAVARDAHWGRTYESFSEEPEVIKQYARHFVRGMQGDLAQESVVACVKHWVGDGGTLYGVDQGETAIAEDELRKLHIAPYVPAIEEGVLTVMASFNSWNGDKCHGHKYLLTDVLKEELDFKGFVISDWDGIDYLHEDYKECIEMATNAGIDMFMVSEKWRAFIAILKELVQEDRVNMERIDDAVRRILYVKLKYGLFEKADPSSRPFSRHASYGSVEHREVAREAVRKSLVLLKNKNHLLPLSKQSRIIVAGKNADNCGHQCGGFTIAWQGVSKKAENAVLGAPSDSIYGLVNAEVLRGEIEGGTSIWEGIKAVAPQSVLNIDGSEADPELHDVGIVVIGETPYAEGMGDVRDGDHVIIETQSRIKGQHKVLNAYANSLELSKIHPEDLSAIENITRKGIPAIVILVSGRPLIVNKELEASTAFVAAWLPGSEGQGVADVIFGDADFQGKLSFTWQKNENENFKRGDQPYQPLFPYGFGLNYENL